MPNVPQCAAIGCRALILPAQLLCETCDRLLQSDLKTILYRQYRPGRKQSQRFEATLRWAQEEILYAKMSGHRTPRDAEFEW